MKQVVWIGRFIGHSGFPTATRRYVRSLLPFVPNLKIASFGALSPNHEFFPLVRNVDDTEFKILNHQPFLDPTAQAYLSVFEFDHIPKIWVDIFNKAKIIMTQSSFCKEIFGNQIQNSEKIHIIPYILGENLRKYDKDGPKLNFSDNVYFDFGSIFDWVPRKVPELTVKAFLKEFSNKEKVRLIFRTKLPNDEILKNQFGDLYHPFLKAIKEERIIILEEIIHNLADFYRSIDTYISCTAGEGYGQTLAESMACGKPTIASNHSGNLEFMNDENSFLVETEDWSFAYEQNGEVYKWKLPIIDDIRKKMRYVYSKRNEINNLSQTDNCIKIREQLTPQNVGKKIYNCIKDFIE